MSESQDLPRGWTWTSLGELLREPLCNGLSVKGSDGPPGIPALRLNAMSNSGFDYSAVRYLPVQWEEVDDLRVEEGDFFVSRGNGSLSLVGRGTLAQKPPPRVIFPDTMIRVRLRADVAEGRWVPSIWAAPQVRRQIEQKVKTTAGIWKIAQGELASVRIPLPPPDERRRIVAEIEKQFTRLDAGVESLRRLRAHLRRYRAAVLKSASEGSLGQRSTAGRDDQRPCALPPAGVTGLHALPLGWRWAPVGSLLTAIEAGKNFRCVERPPEDGEFGVVKVSAVTWGTFNGDESKTATDGSRLDPRLLIRPGDFLFSRANTIDLVGTCVIVASVGRKVMLSDKILRFTVSGADPRWLLWMLRSPVGRREIERLATGNQESMRNIGQDRIREIRIPLPPRPEQEALVREVEARLDVASRIDGAATAALRRSARLRHAILDRAFSGRLTASQETKS